MITVPDIAILKLLADLYVLTREQIQRYLFPSHNQGRATRKRLSKLLHEGLVSKTRTLVPQTADSGGCPIYFLTKSGAEFLASHFDDDSYLRCSTRRPRADLLHHWQAISENHLRIRQAISRQDTVKLLSWVNEWAVLPEVANSRPEQHYLHTVLRETPPLSCSPDAGFVLDVGGIAKVFYLEADRDTSGVKQIAASKPPGYEGLAKRGIFKSRHFPMATVNDFSVLLVTTTEGRRNRLARAIKEKEGAQRWLFCTQSDLTPKSFLHEPITINCQGESAPLVKAPVETVRSA